MHGPYLSVRAGRYGHSSRQGRKGEWALPGDCLHVRGDVDARSLSQGLWSTRQAVSGGRAPTGNPLPSLSSARPGHSHPPAGPRGACGCGLYGSRVWTDHSVKAIHHVSVSISQSQSELVCAEAWGTEPHYSWLHDRATVSQTVGRVSQDGTRLRITQSPVCGRFTCRIHNKLGSATATYTADECAVRDHSGTIAAVTCVLLLLLCGGLLGLLLWR
uniref:Ig-like domain-containing protein n=1 Tax=Knipowitschia caucasica TaxID=637954 RepID=A0AAV2M9D5_KNICA